MVFSEKLVQLRNQAGFKTAWSFYHSNGGRRCWPFTFVHYARMEKGTALPKPDVFPLLVKAFRYPPGHVQFRELVSLYLREYLGGGEGADMILDALSKDAPAPVPDPTAWNKASVSEHITVEQFRVMTSDDITAMSHLVLLNSDTETFTLKVMSKLLDCGEKEITSSLEKLCAAGLADRSAKGGYRSHFSGKWLTLPNSPDVADCSKALNRALGLLEKKRGKTIWGINTLLRAETAAMQQYCPELAQAVLKANINAVPVKSASTGLFMVKALIVRLEDL